MINNKKLKAFFIAFVCIWFSGMTVQKSFAVELDKEVSDVTATASSFVAPFDVSRAVDTSSAQTSRWYSNNIGDKWIQLDLKKVLYIDRWLVENLGSAGWDASCNTRNYKLMGSLNGTDWTQIDIVNNNTSNSTNRTVSGVSARYVKLVITQGNQNNNLWASVMNFKVYAADPVVSSVEVPATKTYDEGEHLDFTVNYTASVAVNTSGGTPKIPVTIGGNTVNAQYISGSGTQNLIFRYTVQRDDLDSDGIALDTSISLSGGTIVDAVGNNAVLTLNSVAPTTGVLVDAVLKMGTLQFDPSTLTVGEGDGTASLTVTRTNGTDGAISVNYGVTGGTATGNGIDYTLANGTLNFAEGETSKNINLTIQEDHSYEVDETIIVTLSNETSGVTMGGNIGTITITDNDPSLLVSAPEALEEGTLDHKTLVLNVTGDAFLDNTLDASNFQLVNAPNGLTIGSVNYDSTKKCTLTLAYDGTDFDLNVTNFLVNIQGAELVSGNDLVAANPLTVTAVNDGEAIFISNSTPIMEGAENGKEITVALTGGTFAPTLTLENWTVTNLPTGTTAGSIIRDSNTSARILLSGNSTADYDTNITNVTVSCTNAEYGDASNGANLTQNMGVTLTANVEAALVTSLSVKTQPSLVYTEGDHLNLGSLVITLHKDNGATEDIAFSDFLTNGILVDVSNGTALTLANNGTVVTVTHMLSGKTVQTGVLTVTPSLPPANQVISIADITGVTAPVNGGTPVSQIAETAQYTGIVVWTPSDVIFTTDSAYTVTITLTPKAGYTFNGVAQNFFTVAGGTATNNSNSNLVTVVFPKTATAGSTTLQNLTIGGNTVAGFSGAVKTYNVTLPHNAQLGSSSLTIGGVATDGDATVTITQVDRLPGDGVVRVTSKDGNTIETYTVHFTIGAVPNTPPVRQAGVAPTGTASVNVNAVYSVNLGTIFRDFNSDPLSYTVSINGAPDILANAAYSYTATAAGVTTLVFKANDGTFTSTDTYTVTLTVTSNNQSTGGSGSGASIGSSSRDDSRKENNTSGGTSTTTPEVPKQTQPAKVVESPTSENKVETITKTTTANGVVGTDGRAVAAVTVNQVEDAINLAKEAIAKAGTGATAQVEIKVTAPANVTTVATSIPKGAVTNVADNKATLMVSTPVAALVFDNKALNTIAGAASGDVSISASTVDTKTLSQEAQQVIGNRPVFNFSVTSEGKTISQFGGAVTVSVPYTPNPGEDTEALVVYYINSTGKLETVTNCTYNAKTGTVNFTTTHFSTYAVGYNKVSFTDVAPDSEYSKAINFIAARGITTGTGGGKFSPDATITRGQFMVMLMKAYGIQPDENGKENFVDAGNTYYTNYLSAAKRLGLTNGTGNNTFSPDKKITQQEMISLLYKTLKVMGKLPTATEGKDLTTFADANQIAPWAKDGMSLFTKAGILTGKSGKLEPTKKASRAQMAQVLYNLLSK